MYRLVYSNAAAEDLQAIYDYIASDSPARASAYLGKIESCVLQLSDFPDMGRVSRYPELATLNIRVLPYDDYLIFYTFDGKNGIINVVRVLHGSVNYKNLF